MAQNTNKALAVNLGVALLPDILQNIENFFGGGDGATKKQVALNVATTAVTVGAGLAEAANPAYAALIGAVLDSIIRLRKTTGNPVIPQTPTPLTSSTSPGLPTVSNPVGGPPASG